MASAPEKTSDPAPHQGGGSQSHSQSHPFRLDALLEPKGFIRGIEFVLAICMFATTAGYSSMFSFQAVCKSSATANPTYNQTVEYPFGYPFSFSEPINTPCSESEFIRERPSGAAKFFVVVGVFAMLYTIAALVWYVVLEVKYLKYEVVAIVDFIATSVFVLLFFIASCAWAAGVSTVKYWTTLENLTDSILDGCTEGGNQCVSVQKASYGALNISIVFGFLNALVWGGNVWFVWKETPWFRARNENQTGGNLDNKV